MGRRRRTIYDRYAPLAQATAALATDPERRGLRSLVAQIYSDRAAEIAAARTTSGVLRSSIRDAAPKVQRLYSDAGSSLSSVSSQIAPAAGPGGDATRAEAAAAQARNIEAGAAARRDLADQGVRAASGAVFATRSAEGRAHADLGKVAQQLLGLDQSEGLRAATELGRLVNAEQGRSVTRRGQTLSHRDRSADRTSRETIAATNRQAAKDRAQAKAAKPKSSVTQTADKHLAVQTSIEDIAQHAGRYVGKLSRPQIVQKLSQGRPQQTVLVDPKTGDPVPDKTPGGRKVTLPKIPSYAADLKMSAALDVALEGHLSRTTQRRLRKAGFSINQLGLPTYGQYQRGQSKRNPTQLSGSGNLL